MDAKKLLDADYLDIIYDHRNKGYGGYELRKNYSRRMKKGVGFLMLGLSALVSFSFISSRAHTNILTDIHPPVVITEMKLPDAPKPPKPITQPASPPQPVKSKIFTPPVITDAEIKPDQQMAEVKELAHFNPGTTNSDSGSDALNPPVTGNNIGGPIAVNTPKTTDIPIFVEQMPAFPGDMQSYLSRNINYPPNAREANVQGRVAIAFVVNEDGTITNAKVTHSLGAGCDEEALRVIKAMPRWKPGKNNGVATKVMFTQAITFKLE